MNSGMRLPELVIVTVGALGLVSLLLFIQGSQRGRTRAEIVRALLTVWAAVAGMIAAGAGARFVLGEVFEVQLTGGARLLWQSLGPAQIAILVGLLVVAVALYVVAYGAIRRLLAPQPPLSVGAPGDDEGEDG